MTSRERVLSALNHRAPDCVPIDFSGYRSSGIAAMAYPKLRAALGLPPRAIRVYDPIQLDPARLAHRQVSWGRLDPA